MSDRRLAPWEAPEDAERTQENPEEITRKSFEAEEAAPREDGEAPHRRRRRSERYQEEAEDSRERYTVDPVMEGGSQTAQEVANRYRQRAERGAVGETRRMPTPESRAADAYARNRMPDRGARDQVGYAPGRMGMTQIDRARMSQAGRARLEEEIRMGGSRAEYPEAGGAARTRGLQENPYGGRPAITGKKKPGRRKWLIAVIAAVVALGLLFAGTLLIPEDAEGLPGTIRQAVANLLPKKKQQTGTVLTLRVAEQDSPEAPAVIVFEAEAENSVEDLRLVDGNGTPLVTRRDSITPQEEKTVWLLSWQVETAWSGKVYLQQIVDGTWTDTSLSADITVMEPTEEPDLPVDFSPEGTAGTQETPGTEQEAVTGTEEATGDESTEDGTALSAEETGDSGTGTPEEMTDAGDAANAGMDPDAPEEWSETAEDPDAPVEWAETAEDPDAPVDMTETAEDLDAPEDMTETAELPEEEGAEDLTAEAEPDDAETARAEDAGEETASAEKPEETAKPADREEKADDETKPERKTLTAAAAESADPSLITTAVIYNGSKKAAEYARADSEKIHMPTLGEYTRQKMGVLTFRTDAFRQNGAIGTVPGLNSLEIKWTAEAGSVKGSGQNYYGVGWVGQPAIVKWSKEVREQSDMYDAKKETQSLKEVIVGGLDGRIYFLDLADGTATRNSIKLGYPMKGSPSVHPGGFPYMTVGQFARKMASGTGTIGLRQYNLYQLKELSLIDGLDAKNNRPYNKVGSFETSALIDRTTGTMITAGTNGMLYLINLNSDFDYGAGTYTQSPTTVVMKSKAKNEKDPSTAVEASVAMYDRYVYYADLGGILRCVDTNTLKTVWAVALSDAVESTPALDWHGEDGLDLYAATELTLHKNGEAEVTCFDALTGEARWTAAFGVRKDTKNKSVSGFRASPVVGQNGLSEYVYYTVNNLSEEGREQLNVGEAEAAVVALRKDDGSTVWARGLSGRGYSSPVAVYDKEGNGAIIQCAGDGSIVMLDGVSGKELASLQIDGAIEASPAVYDGTLVIGTTERNKNNIYGIRIE